LGTSFYKKVFEKEIISAFEIKEFILAKRSKIALCDFN